jgi:hypothetical protein
MVRSVEMGSDPRRIALLVSSGWIDTAHVVCPTNENIARQEQLGPIIPLAYVL